MKNVSVGVFGISKLNQPTNQTTKNKTRKEDQDLTWTFQANAEEELPLFQGWKVRIFLRLLLLEGRKKCIHLCKSTERLQSAILMNREKLSV